MDEFTLAAALIDIAEERRRNGNKDLDTDGEKR
jgi:hypothetical protein